MLDVQGVQKSAVLSLCQTYRYLLTRTWDEDLPEAVFVMLNPSTADDRVDDATIRRCMSFARSWRCGEIKVVNLFAARCTDPARLSTFADPIGPENDGRLTVSVTHHSVKWVVCAWGAQKGIQGRVRDVRRLLRNCGVKPVCLGLTKDGHPRHPLYARKDSVLVPYECG